MVAGAGAGGAGQSFLSLHVASGSSRWGHVGPPHGSGLQPQDSGQQSGSCFTAMAQPESAGSLLHNHKPAQIPEGGAWAPVRWEGEFKSLCRKSVPRGRPRAPLKAKSSRDLSINRRTREPRPKSPRKCKGPVAAPTQHRKLCGLTQRKRILSWLRKRKPESEVVAGPCSLCRLRRPLLAPCGCSWPLELLGLRTHCSQLCAPGCPYL